MCTREKEAQYVLARFYNLQWLMLSPKMEIDDVAIEVTNGSTWSVIDTLIVNKYIDSSEL